MDEEYRRSRSELRRKKRLGSLVNGLIGIVVLLIIIVGASIFLGDKPEEEKAEQNGSSLDERELEEDINIPDEIEEDEGQEDNRQKEEEPQVDDKPASNVDSADRQIITDSEDENVIRTIIDPSWEPIGTVQEGEHVTVYDGIDWDEMVKAISYATGIDEEQMTIHWLGNNGFNKSVGTVYTKNKANIYRVYLEWVDSKGWKPTMVEELAAIIEEDEAPSNEASEEQGEAE